MLSRLVLCSGLAMGLATTVASAASKAPPRPEPQVSRSLLDCRLYQLDQAHSSIEFAVPWMGLTKVRGTFSEVLGTIAFVEDDLTRSSITVVARVSSLTTGNERRDNHLKSADFFDAEKFPNAVFSSTGIERTGSSYTMRGALAIHGVTREVAIPFHYLGHVVDTDSTGHRLGFEARLAIRRKDYGVVGPPDFNQLTSLGALTIGDEVDLTFSVQGWIFTPRKMQDPVADSLYRRIAERGVATVTRDYRALRARTPDSLMTVSESVLNSVGHFLLQNARTDDAVGIFALEAEVFPNSAFAQVGLGQAWAAAGIRERALEHCRRAVALNPSATRAIEVLRRLEGSRN